MDVRTRKKPEKPPPPYLILHSVCILSLFQRSRFQRGQINDPGKIAAAGEGRESLTPWETSKFAVFPTAERFSSRPISTGTGRACGRKK